MFPVTSQLPPAWALPAILEELATATSDVEALSMCLQRLREEGGRPDGDDAVRLWAFVEEARSYAAALRGHADDLGRQLLDAFLTPDGWPLDEEDEERFREALASRHAEQSVADGIGL
jgi:hypothetical protein